MTTLASDLGSPLVTVANLRGRAWVALLIWLGASTLAIFFALVVSDSTLVDGAYLPRGNDSFYHARRILDAAVGTRGFYQFDERLHAPDGAWIPWPWAYDWLMAKATQLALAIAPHIDPAGFIAYVPVLWVLINAGLFLLAARAIGLSEEMQVIALLCFAISPLTQLLHSIGMVDHHYVEHTFVLLTLWLGLRWLERPEDAWRAGTLGCTLALATAFHSGLFILQLLPLTTVAILWLRGVTPSAGAVSAFIVALVSTTQLVLLPSEPYWQGLFEFGLLSWFHLYAAACSSAALAFMAWHPVSRGSLMGLALLCLALVAPLGGQLLGGAGFLSGSFSVLNLVIEVHSPYRLFTETYGPEQTASYYSWLMLGAPALLAWFAYRTLREQRPERLYYAVAVVFGLTLSLMQFRLHYFGFLVFVTGALLLVDQLRARHGWHRGAVFAAALGITVLAYQPALRERLFVVYSPGADNDYAAALPIFQDLGTLCADDPGVVLANSNDGNPILFHSDCGVIANNFILRPEDERHLDEIGRLMRLDPAQIGAQRPDIKYVFVRAASFSIVQDGTGHLAEEIPIAKRLFLDAAPPAGFTLIRTIVRDMEGGPDSIYARLFKVDASVSNLTSTGGPIVR